MSHLGDYLVTEVRASHILVNNPKLADKIYKKATAGKDFAKLARKFSDCPSGNNGGDLGYFTRGKMVKEFEDAAFSMQPGQLSQPIQTKFGYHIIKVTDQR
jgi:parvulin-like peptidyl-prolyl isomerase